MTRRALLIGIDDYPSLTKLEGCVNDVRLMSSVLTETFGFAERDITVLSNGQATRAGILAALEALVEASGPDDAVVVHYAGHGSQMTDREGDEPDGMDETIMPYDSEGRWGENRDITDDEIGLWVERLAEKTPRITLIFDSCHSGTITRDAFGERGRSIEPDTRPISQLPPSPIRVSDRGRLRTRDAGPSGWLPLASRYVLLAGCRDEETSFEYRPPEGEGKVVHGALTYFLSAELRQAVPGTTYREVFERAAAKVTSANAGQHPQLEGRTDRELFGVSEPVVMAFVRVTGRSAGTVTLGRGAAGGMTAGSVWSVYPPNTRSAEGAAPLGRVEVTEVRAVSADAKVLDEVSPGAIVADSRAVETSHSWGTLKLGVQLEGSAGAAPALDRLREEVQRSTLVELASTETAAVRVYALPARESVRAGDLVLQAGSLPAPRWAAVGRDGQMLMPLLPLDATEEVRRNLETLARYRRALALDNPDSASPLRGRFDLELLRRAPDGRWVVAEPEACGGRVVFEEGESIAFRITSHWGEPVYVSLLDFGVTGSVSLVYPAPGARERLAPRTNFEIGTRPGASDFSLAVPPELHGDEGVETLKLFVTTHETDFGFLTQQGVSGGGTRSARDIVASLSAGREDWTTVVQSFVLRRRRAATLDPTGAPVPLGDATLRTPGIAGEAVAHPWQSERARVASLVSSDLSAALDGAGVEVRQTLEIGNARRSARPSRGDDGDRGEMELRVREPGPGYGQMVMTTDELGAVRWHFAQGPAPATRGDGAGPGALQVYRLPGMAPQAAPATATARGLMGAVGKKFLNVLVFPMIEPGIGAVGESFALKWEGKHRPYRLRWFRPDDYTGERAVEIGPEEWTRLGAGRALLLVHGTFSRAHAAFGGLPKDYVEALHRQYDGRVFAFDHFSLSHDPRMNIGWLLDRLPGSASLDLDIVCHSRGGLVSRLLAEKQGELSTGSRQIKVGKIVFVGSPNAGTILADARHMGDLIDTYTNLLNFLPDNGLTEILAGIVTVAKMLAVGAAKGLPGLQSMCPGGEFATWLNAGPRSETRYFALSSDFTPGEPGLRQLATDRLMDRIFKASNDLVVPTDGVFSANGSDCFPIEERLVFKGPGAVAHTGYFASRATRDQMLAWLGA